MADKRFLAVDLGAESGRVVVGTLAQGRLALEEIRRFANEPVEVCGTLHWDALCLYNNILKGLSAYVLKYGERADGIGVDTWGVDFALLGSDGAMLQEPVHYRDRRTDAMPALVARKMNLRELYDHTGINLLPIYTLCQMAALRTQRSPALRAAERFLMMADLFGYFLSGRAACERTNAITTQLYNPRTAGWDAEVFRTFDLPLKVMPDIIEPGTVLGELTEAAKARTGLASAPVIAPCTHDTASAVSAVPAQGRDWAYISSGTWSIIGALIDEVVTSDAAFDARMSNELCLEGLRICQNNMGLWLLQQTRAAWARQGRSVSYAEMVRMAEDAPRAEALIAPNDPGFMAPRDMPQAIREFCARTGQSAPEGDGALLRCIMESLALSYRYTLDRMAEMLGRTFRTLHVVGGGSQNELLCRFAADATGLCVQTGPVEATVAGNVLVQALACGAVESAQQIRDIVRASTEMTEYEPQEAGYWEERYGGFLELMHPSGA
jgi:rhamnulokinase